MELELKTLANAEVEAALALAERSRTAGEPDVAESICLDVLEVVPDDQRALVLLLLARTDLLERALPGGVDRAREVLPRLTSDFDRAYYNGVVCERQARVLLRQRGRHPAVVAYEWFGFAMDEYEAARGLDPARTEPTLRWNACVRTLERNPQCIPTQDESQEHGIE